METEIIRVEDTEDIDEKELERAARLLREGELVAFPTETVYGLGANAMDEQAARKIYEAKGRPSDNPLIAHIASMEGLRALVSHVPEAGLKLADRFWPGPLTMVFPKSRNVPYGTTGGLETVAVRMPSDPVAHKLLEMAGVPIAAPSANTSGRPSPTTADHVYQDMQGRIAMIVDGGTVGIGVESTIVDVTGPVPVILRPGAITHEMLTEVLGEVLVDPAVLGPVKTDTRPQAPGMKYRHYAPKAELVLVEGQQEKVVAEINRLAGDRISQGYEVGVICTDETLGCYRNGQVRSIGPRSHEETIAHNLYALLREFDDLGVDFIYSESFGDDHLGQAIMNRLMKAAGYHRIYVQPEWME